MSQYPHVCLSPDCCKCSIPGAAGSKGVPTEPEHPVMRGSAIMNDMNKRAKLTLASIWWGENNGSLYIDT